MILVALVLALLFAGLVPAFGWEPEWALVAVVGRTTVVATTLAVLPALLAGKGERSMLWQAFAETMKRDWDEVRRWFGIGR